MLQMLISVNLMLTGDRKNVFKICNRDNLSSYAAKKSLTLAGTGGVGVDATPAGFLEYLFSLLVECHHFVYSVPPIFCSSPLKISRP